MLCVPVLSPRTRSKETSASALAKLRTLSATEAAAVAEVVRLSTEVACSVEATEGFGRPPMSVASGKLGVELDLRLVKTLPVGVEDFDEDLSKLIVLRALAAPLLLLAPVVDCWTSGS